MIKPKFKIGDELVVIKRYKNTHNSVYFKDYIGYIYKVTEIRQNNVTKYPYSYLITRKKIRLYLSSKGVEENCILNTKISKILYANG